MSAARQPLEVAQIHLSKKQEKNTAADTPIDSKVLAAALGHKNKKPKETQVIPVI